MEPKHPTRVLVNQARQGDRAAFDELISRQRGRLKTLTRLRIGADLRSKVEIDDVLQEVSLRAFKSIQGANFDSEQAVVGWLATITDRVIVDLARRHASRPASPLDRDIPRSDTSPSRRLRREERFDRLQQALDRLSPDHREVIVLARIQGLPFAEIGRRMNRSHDAVAQLLSRALRKLRSHFGNTESWHLPDRYFEGQEKGHD